MKGESSKKQEILLGEQSLYPYLKITNEKFPRLLVTRKIEDDKAEYFGAFLPETGVRFFIDFLNKLFKLRTCTIEINGNFDVPCPQFYAKRCLAPCVESLCDEAEYAEAVELLRLFLKRQNGILTEKLLEKIGKYAEDLDFETASEWRDKLQKIEDFWNSNEWILWLDKAKDNWEIERKNGEIFIFLVTMRGRKTLGEKVFVFDDSTRFSDAEILERILSDFYRFHAPSEIRVPVDFSSRKHLAKKLEAQANRKIEITVINKIDQKITVERAFGRNKHEYDLRNIKPPVSTNELEKEIKQIFKLKHLPQRIEAFDVAHISGTNPVGASAVWENGKFAADEYGFWFFDETSELETLERSISARFSDDANTPDLVLIDGGKSQLKAALKALENTGNKKFLIISAVKPPRRHGEISHFLTETDEKIMFDSGSDAFRFLQRLRDEAHTAANSVHRTSRDFSHFYELAAVVPSINEKTRRAILRKAGSINNLKNASFENLKADFGLQLAEIVWKDLDDHKRGGGEQKIIPPLVPIRYDDPNGEAQNLQPLQSFNR